MKDVVTILVIAAAYSSCVTLMYLYPPREFLKNDESKKNHFEALILQITLMINFNYNLIILSFRPKWHICLGIHQTVFLIARIWMKYLLGLSFLEAFIG